MERFNKQRVYCSDTNEKQQILVWPFETYYIPNKKWQDLKPNQRYTINYAERSSNCRIGKEGIKTTILNLDDDMRVYVPVELAERFEPPLYFPYYIIPRGLVKKNVYAFDLYESVSQVSSNQKPRPNEC